MSNPTDHATDERATYRGVVRAAFVVLGALLAALFFWRFFQLFLLLFAGALLAVFLRSLSDPLAERTGLSSSWSLLAVVLGLLALAILAGWLLWPSLADQAAQLAQELPKAVELLRQRLEQDGLGRWLLDQAPSWQDQRRQLAGSLKQVLGIFSSVAGGLGALAVILIIGLYLAYSPGLYARGVLRLIPRPRRAEALDVMRDAARTLSRWTLGRILDMLAIGVLTWLGLLLLGAPLPVALALVAALLSFIPNLGPILSLVPAALLVLASQGVFKAGLICALYFVIQTLESYALLPMIQFWAVSLPPILTISAQILLSLFSGVLGLAMATPMAAVALTLVRRLWVEKALGDDMDASIERDLEQEAAPDE